MLAPALILMATVVAQGGGTDSFFREGEEAIVYTYRVEAEREGRISRVLAVASFAVFVEYQKAAHAADLPRCRELERRGDVYWVEGGTRCRVIRGGGMSVGPIVRTAQEVRLLNGAHKGRGGWVEASHLRPRMHIRVQPPEPTTDENWDTPRPLALAFQAQDKVIYRELLDARAKAMAAARAASSRERRRGIRYRVFRREQQAVLERYRLDEPTAMRILEWGKLSGWPTDEPGHEARSAS
jgi:hypothetical protein